MNRAEQFINCREQFHAGKEKGKRMRKGEGMRKGMKESRGNEKDEQAKHMKNSMSWDISPCSVLKVSRRFGGICHFHFSGLKSKPSNKST
jgi:hypothetical protein